MLHKHLIALFILFMPGMAFAHAGHGHIDSHSIWHDLLEWEHRGLLLAAVILLLLAVITWRIVARRAARAAAKASEK